MNKISVFRYPHVRPFFLLQSVLLFYRSLLCFRKAGSWYIANTKIGSSASFFEEFCSTSHHEIVDFKLCKIFFLFSWILLYYIKYRMVRNKIQNEKL